MAATLHVVAQSQPVALDDGRHLHPGEIAKVPESERIQRFIDSGALVLVTPKSPTSKTSSGSDQQEASNDAK